MWGRSAGAIPGPSSVTITRASRPWSAISTDTASPAREYFKAFSSRLITKLWSRSPSPRPPGVVGAAQEAPQPLRVEAGDGQELRPLLGAAETRFQEVQGRRQGAEGRPEFVGQRRQGVHPAPVHLAP